MKTYSFSKTLIILTLFFYLFVIPLSIAELERSSLVKNAGPEVKVDGKSRIGYTPITRDPKPQVGQSCQKIYGCRTRDRASPPLS